MNNFNTANRIVSNREKLRSDIIHQEKLKNMKSMLKIDTPKSQSHIGNNYKKKQLKDQENNKILNENKVLLKKMLEIDKNPQTLNPTSMTSVESPLVGSLNKNLRYQEWSRVIGDNKKFLDRLGKVKTHYNIEEQLYSHAQQEYLQQRIRENAGRNDYSKNKLGSFNRSAQNVMNNKNVQETEN